MHRDNNNKKVMHRDRSFDYRLKLQFNIFLWAIAVQYIFLIEKIQFNI